MLGSRSEGDWTCRDCGNVNFSFRTVCNRSHCGAPRQVVSPVSHLSYCYYFVLLTCLLMFL